MRAPTCSSPQIAIYQDKKKEVQRRIDKILAVNPKHSRSAVDGGGAGLRRRPRRQDYQDSGRRGA